MATAERVSEQLIALQGELKFGFITALRKQVEQMLANCSGEIEIDFAKVSASDSSALSFWLCCQRFADGNQLVLKPLNVPSEMSSFARLVGLNNQLSG